MENILTIITVCYNSFNSLEKTFQSVLRQSFHGFEYIVVDGGSNDGTVDLIKKYESIFSSSGIDFSYISERDNGIYDAMNKGIILASNQWIEFLNSGDIYSKEDILLNVVGALESSDSDVVYGDYFYVDGFRKKYFASQEIDKITEGMVLGHESLFVRKSVHSECLYSEKYKIASDYELLLKLFLNGHTFRHIPIPIIVFFADGISSTKSSLAYMETQQIRIENGLIFDDKNTKRIISREAKRIRLYNEILPSWFRALWEMFIKKNQGFNIIV